MNPDTTNPTTSIWISKITKKERKICLRRFKGTGCDTANEDLPQQLIIRECRMYSQSAAG
jgi:hypothetical protein